MTFIAQLFKLTHREQNLSSSLQNSKHSLCFTHILQFKMALLKCTEHGSLHKTQQSDIKSHVCHFKTLPFKMTLHELIGQNTCHLAKHLNALLLPLQSGSKHYKKTTGEHLLFYNNNGRRCRERKRKREGENERGRKSER